MAKNKVYTDSDIQALSDREHVRMRTQIYLGSMHPTEFTLPVLERDRFSTTTVEFIPAVYKAVNEIIDNSLDEFSQITSKKKVLTLDGEFDKGTFFVGDNGRGIPINTHSVMGIPTPQVALGSLKAGRNFTDDKEVGVIGQNGVGAACTNYCSSLFDVTIKRDGKQYKQQFTDGYHKASKPVLTDAQGTVTGTQIQFTLDPTVFKNTALPESLMKNRALEIAMTNPDVQVSYKGTTYQFKGGLLEALRYSGAVTDTTPHYVFTLNTPTATGQFVLVFDAHDSIDEQAFTWVNSSYLFDGGKCNTQFFNALFDRTITELEKQAKKAKVEVTRNDVRYGLRLFASIKLKNPEYDSQAKTRLTGPDLRKELVQMVDSSWKGLTKNVSSWFENVLVKAAARHHKQKDKEAVNDLSKRTKRAVPGLLDATSKVRTQCSVLITEGESAKSKICEARDPETVGAYALTGKINNVYGATVAQALKMGKIAELLIVLGLVPGKKAVRSELNYGRVVIATDADFDGDDIFTLLVNLLYQFWPELFDPNYEPFVYRLVAPNVCAVKGDKRVHFSKRADYEKVRDKYKSYEIRYYKGLGAMETEDWEMILSDPSKTWIPIIGDSNMGNVLKLLFGDDVQPRKEWLTAQ